MKQEQQREERTAEEILSTRDDSKYSYQYDDIISAMKEYANQFKATQEWISVKDRLPEYGEWYLVNTNKRGVIECLYDSKYIWLTIQGDLRKDEIITHWMPLPKNPKS